MPSTRAPTQPERYRMKAERRADAVSDLAALPVRGAYLDVSCGQGDMLDEALKLGFAPVHGTEIVPALIDGHRVVRAEVHALPFADKSFDVVDHVRRDRASDSRRRRTACRELARVARCHVLLTANNRPSLQQGRRRAAHQQPALRGVGPCCASGSRRPS